MYHGDCQTDTTVSDTQPAASYPLASTQHKARQSEHTTHERNRGNKRRVRERLGGWGGGSGLARGESHRVQQQGPQPKKLKGQMRSFFFFHCNVERGSEVCV